MIKKHRFIFGYNKTIVRAALDLVDTFENVKGALWRDYPEMNKRKAEPKGINWTIYHVMPLLSGHKLNKNNWLWFPILLLWSLVFIST